jgi:DivIVA domain-containing protein
VSFFLIFLAIALAGAVMVYVLRLREPAGQTDPAVLNDGLHDPVANLPPVLLPADPEPADVDRVRFSLGLRGYRMDQVDEVLDVLRDQLAMRNRRIADLEQQLAGGAAAPHLRSAAAPEVRSGTAPELQDRQE